MGEGKPLLPEGSPFELWDVRLVSGDAKLSIDELDAAFEMGRIDVHTLVRRRGTVKWTTLGEAANLQAAELQGESRPPAAAVTAPATPRPAIPRPTPRRTLPPPLPVSVALPIEVVAPPPPPPPPIVEIAPTPTVSSLPPPMTLSAPPATARDDELDADATFVSRRPKSRRNGLFAASFFAALVGGATAAALTIPSVNHRVTELASAARGTKPEAITTPAVAPPAPPAPPPPPPAASVLPPPAAPAVSSSAPTTKPKRATASPSKPPSHRH